jgi:Zn-dependent M28 family amino/carboxypeptidase/predicted small secreted protein
MMRSAVVLLFAAPLLAGCNTVGVAHDRVSMERAAVAINETVYRKHVERLASDEFEGRAPGSAGERKTVEYLEQEFLALGLQPVDGASFRQTVPLVEITAVPAQTYLTVAARSGQVDLALGEEMVLNTRRVLSESAILDSDLVFVGYGIVAPEYGWDDYAGLDMRGKTALILVNDPGYASGDPGLFRGRAMTYYGRWTYKFEEAARQGAAAALIIHQTAPAAYPWEVVRNSWSGPRLSAESPDGNAAATALEGWITEARARELLELAGEDFDALALAARQPGFRPRSLGLVASGGVRNIIRRARSANVAGVLPGRDLAEEYVVYMAHWDHLGRSLSLAGDNIMNGAVDNASGVAGILAIAAAYRELLIAPARSVLFLAVTAEEAGLVGSAHYARHPLVPLEKTAAVINIDGMHPLGRAHDIEVIGSGASELEEYLAEAARRQGRLVKPDSAPEQGTFYRSDHFSLAKVGVPALFTKSGKDLRDRPAGSGEAMVEEYTRERYHRPGDVYDTAWDVSGSIEDLKLLFEVGLRVANSAHWPLWYADNEFRAVREASEDARRRAP